MKRIAVLLPDGVGIRNYMFSSFIKRLIESKGIEVILVHSVTDGAILAIEEHNNYIFEKYKLPLIKESFKLRFYRELIRYARLIFNKELISNHSVMDNWNPQKNKVSKQMFYFVLEKIQYFFVNNYKKILSFEAVYDREILKESYVYKDFLKELNLDVIFCTNQRANNSIPFISEANSMNIKTIGAVFSWDNIPKANLSLKTKEYVVWSQHMKSEMELFYPEIAKDSITVTGTPQFEFYSNESLIADRSKFFEQYNLDEDKKVICFSGCDIRTSPYDQVYLEDLAEEISKMPLNEQPQIIFRKVPVDFSDRYDKVLDKYSALIKVIEPIWEFDSGQEKSWKIVYPKFDDVKLLVNIAYYSDLVYNLGSTMAHDFAMYNKPAIYVKYEVCDISEWSSDIVYKFQHFKSMPSKSNVIWVKDKKEIKTAYLEAINFDENSKNMHSWVDIIAEDRQNASRNIVNLITK